MGAAKASAFILACLFILLFTLYQNLPGVIDRVLHASSPRLERLKIGHAMAGGGVEGSLAMANAIKTMCWSRIFGVKETASRLAYRELLRTLREAEQSYLSPQWGFGLDPNATAAASEIAEGLKYVAHVQRLAYALFLEDSPQFLKFVDPNLKMLGDNPSAQYYVASLLSHDGADGQHEHAFVIEGCRSPHEVYLSLSVHAESTKNGGAGAFDAVVTHINDNDILFDERGCYKIILSPYNPETAAKERAVWLETPVSATSVVTRHYFNSWPPGAFTEKVDVSIRPLRDEASARSPPVPLSDTTMAWRLHLANDFLRKHTVLLPQPDPATTPPFFSLFPNTIGTPQKWSKDNKGMGAVDVAYAAGRFLLEPDQALILRGTVAPC